MATQKMKDASGDLTRLFDRRLHDWDFRPTRGEEMLKRELAPYCKKGEQ